MTQVFADTFYYIAFLNPRDEHHLRVVSSSVARQQKRVTTEAVLLEVADAFAAGPMREKAYRYLSVERRSAETEILPLTPRLVSQGLQLYGARLDKAWSLTDCLSFIVMQDLNITTALTADHHFQQAGFEALFSDPL